MSQIQDKRIPQCLNDIQKYEKWGNLLAGQSWVHLFNSNAPVSASAIHNGLECVKAKGLFRIIQSIPSPKAEPFKLWLAQVGYDRIQEIENPELAQERMKLLYTCQVPGT